MSDGQSIFSDSRTISNSNNINLVKKTSGITVEFKNWYLDDANNCVEWNSGHTACLHSANPRVDVWTYIKGSGSGMEVSNITSAITFANNDKRYPSFVNLSNCSITYGTSSKGSGWSSWHLSNSYFASQGPLTYLCQSGNMQLYNSKYEWLAFQVKRYDTATHGDGTEWAKAQVRVKPYKKPSITFTEGMTSSGVINTNTPNISVEIDWNDSIYEYLPESLQDQACKIEIINNVNGNTVKTYYVKRNARASWNSSTQSYGYIISTTEWDLPNSDFTNLEVGVAYYLKVTPGMYFRNVFYSYIDVYKTSTTFKKDLTPRASGLKIEPISIGLVRNFDITPRSFTWKFNTENYGVLNKIEFKLVSGGLTTALDTYVGTVGTISIPMSKVVWDQDYKLQAKLYYNDSFYDTYESPIVFIKSIPKPLNVPKLVGTYTSPYSDSALQLSWSYENTPHTSVGIANGYNIKLYDGSSVVYNYDQYVPSYDNTGSSISIDTRLPSIPKGKYLKLEIYPFFEASINGSSQRMTGTPLVVDNFIMIDFGVNAIEMVAPIKTENPNYCWFEGDTDQGEKSQFKIAFVLPRDPNLDYVTPEERSAYRYTSLTVTYKGDTTEIHPYTTDQNSTELNPTWICVSGDGELTHQNSVIIDLTGINVNPDDNNQYTITIDVTTPYGSEISKDYVITIVPFPLTSYAQTDDYITASDFEKFINCFKTVNSYTMVADLDIPSQGDYIRYDVFKNLVMPFNTLYNLTKNWTNVKKYVEPRSLNSNGVAILDAPYYMKDYERSPEVYDRIYTIKNTPTTLNPVHNMPSDYSRTYNKYFQMSEDYVFRCTNSNMDSDVPIVDDPYITLDVQGGHAGISSNYYIAVPDKELQADYRYEIDWQTYARTDTAFGFNVSCAIGGSYDVWIGVYGRQYADGLFIGCTYASQECLGLRSGYNTGTTMHWDVPQMGEVSDFNDRHTTVFQVSEAVTPNVRTNGGFFIMAGRNYLTGEAFVEDPGTVDIPATSVMSEDYGRIYEIKIYDSSDNLIMDFIPYLDANGHKGMKDLVDETFYPCNDDSMFTIHNLQTLPIYSADEYNVLWSYYRLYRNNQTKTPLS